MAPAWCLLAPLSAQSHPSLTATRLSVFFQEQEGESSAWIRCAFSRNQDLLLNFRRKPAENGLINSYETKLIDRGTKLDIDATRHGEVIHSNGDDATPWHLNGTYLGGNHGCNSVLELTTENLTLTDADIGSCWKDDSGAVFYLIAIPAPGKVWMLSENLAEYPFWKFNTDLTGSTLTRSDGQASLTFTSRTVTQLWPCARIKKQRFLADGKKPLRSGQALECEFLELVEEYDLINPASLLADIIKHPGRKADFVAPHLEAVLANRVVSRISPHGAIVTTHFAKALQPFHLEFMGFIQQAMLQKPPAGHLRYYIPKAAPFSQDGTEYDFAAIQNFDAPPPSELRFTGDDSPGHRSLPERFIQLIGDPASPPSKNRVGFALGYSLTSGLTALDHPSWRRKSAGFIYTSGKTYPFALDGTLPNPIPTGATFDCTVYRQYFDPSQQKAASCVYWHQEDSETIVYADYHQPVSGDAIALPSSLHGRPFRILEKSEGMQIEKTLSIPREGLKVSSPAAHGFLVIAVGPP